LLRAGIIGLPNAGKSTLYNSISASHHAMIANYPFSTIEPNIGIVSIPDERLNKLTEIFKPPKSVRSNFEIFDIAGLVKGASKGEGLGNQFLSHIREVDAIIHIVRCFENEDVSHVTGKINPGSDIETVETELILKDLETIENKIQKTHKLLKTGEKKLKEEYDFYAELKNHLSTGKLAKYFTGGFEFRSALSLLTDKHFLYVANVDDKNLTGNEYSKTVETIARQQNEQAVILSAEVESELTRLESKERTEFMKMLGIQESGLDKLIHSVYSLLGLITFYTVNEKELHAWAIHSGARAPQAAGAVHSDFEKGFIKAEVMKYDDVVRLGSHHAVKEHGLLHIEGKDYEVKDSDIIYFRFHM
jgi:ribosome-binding ATPase